MRGYVFLEVHAERCRAELISGRRMRRGVRAAYADLLSLQPVFIHPDSFVPSDSGPWQRLPATYADIARALRAHYGVSVGERVPASFV